MKHSINFLDKDNKKIFSILDGNVLAISANGEKGYFLCEYMDNNNYRILDDDVSAFANINPYVIKLCENDMKDFPTKANYEVDGRILSLEIDIDGDCIYTLRSKSYVLYDEGIIKATNIFDARDMLFERFNVINWKELGNIEPPKKKGFGSMKKECKQLLSLIRK